MCRGHIHDIYTSFKRALGSRRYSSPRKHIPQQKIKAKSKHKNVIYPALRCVGCSFVDEVHFLRLQNKFILTLPKYQHPCNCRCIELIPQTQYLKILIPGAQVPPSRRPSGLCRYQGWLLAFPPPSLDINVICVLYWAANITTLLATVNVVFLNVELYLYDFFLGSNHLNTQL